MFPGSRSSIAILIVGVMVPRCSYELERVWTDSNTSVQDVGISFSDLLGPPATDAGVAPDQGLVADAVVADQRPPDVSVDAAAGPPCALGTPLESYAAEMVICDLAAKTPQCEAAKACNAAAGWRLCTATEFLDRGGRDKPTAAVAWLGSCIRSGGAPHAPTDSICGPCQAAGIATVDLAWPCPPINGSAYGNGDHVGVGSSNMCLRIGTNDAAWEGFWEPGRLNQPRTAAVCCR